MSNTTLVDRRILVQINATIIAGMLIFLTVGDFQANSNFRDLTFIAILLGFGSLMMSMIACFATSQKHVSYSDKKLGEVFAIAEILFLAGISFLFATVILSLYGRIYP